MMLDSGGQHLSELNGGMINLFGGDADGLSWKLLTTVYNCAQIKLTIPRYGGSLWDMLLSIPTGDGHDQEQDSEYHTRISKPGQVHSRHRDHLGHSQDHGAQIPAPPRTGRHAPSASQSSFQA